AEALKEVVQSDYTGWHLAFDRKFDNGIALLHNVTDIWMLLGLSVIIAGLIWFTYVTHRNYRPIQTIVGKIQDYSRQKSYGFERKDAGNEFQFIESAINGLVDKTSQYEKDHKEDLIMRKNQWFIDLLEGNRVLPEQ